MGVNINRITAADFLEARINSGRSGDDLVAFKQLTERLERHPKVKERLAFEFLEITQEAIESSCDPSVGVYGFFFHSSVTQSRRIEYLVNLEGIITRLFRTMERGTFLDDERCPIAFTLRIALSTLRGMDARRFRAAVSALRKTPGFTSGSELRRRILAQAGQTPAQIEQAIRQLLKQGRKEQIQGEEALASHTN